MITLSIQKLLKEKGISRYELAKRIGVSYPTIDNIYKGRSTSIKFEILESICIELDCTPNDIFNTSNPQLERLMTYAKIIKSSKDDE